MSSLTENHDPAGNTRSSRRTSFSRFWIGSRMWPAAESLRLNRYTCRKWASRAGFRGRPGGPVHPGRGEYFRLREAGSTRKEAARRWASTRAPRRTGTKGSATRGMDASIRPGCTSTTHLV